MEQLFVHQKEMFSALVQQKKMEEYAFSAVSFTNVTKAIGCLGYPLKGRLAFPDLSPHMPLPTDIDPYVWAERQKEVDAAPELLRRLASWVKGRANPPIPNIFFDVQALAAKSPMQITVDEVGRFSGMPDVIVPYPSVDSFLELSPITMSAIVSIDWKSAKAFRDVKKMTAIGHIQALAFGELCPWPVPVFLTDMATGFRCWIVIKRALYYLHPSDALLSLAEGVALMRYFLSHSDGEGSSFRVSNGTLVVGRAEAPSSSSELGSVEPGSSSGCADRSDGGSGGGQSAGTGDGSDTKSCNDAGDDCGGGTSCRFRTPERKGVLSSFDDSGEYDSEADLWQETVLAIARSQAAGGGMPRLDFSFKGTEVSPSKSPTPL